MNQNNSGGFLRGLLYAVIGVLLGAIVGLLIHWVAAGQLDLAHFFERADLMDPLSWLLGIVVGVIAFFYGLVGYRWITRGLVWNVVFPLFWPGPSTTSFIEA